MTAAVLVIAVLAGMTGLFLAVGPRESGNFPPPPPPPPRFEPITMPATCATCRFWHREEIGSCAGECRRYSPTTPGTRVWPQTFDRDSCGEHEGGRPHGALGSFTL